MNKIIIAISILLALSASLSQVASAAQEESSTATTTATNSTSTTKKLFTYAGPLLPSDWSLVSIFNDRAVIGFNNGSARNAPLEELDSKERVLLQKLQNGTLYTTPLQGAKEKIAQWSSQVSSTVTKLGKSVRDQLDSLINNKDKNKEQPFYNSSNFSTTIVN